MAITETHHEESACVCVSVCVCVCVCVRVCVKGYFKHDGVGDMENDVRTFLSSCSRTSWDWKEIFHPCLQSTQEEGK